MTSVKHNLKHNGAAYNESAELINPDPKVTSGRGRALCTCGWLSDEVDTGALRRKWFKDHKASVAAQATTSPEPHAQAAWEADLPEQSELVLGQDVLAGTPEDEVKEALQDLLGDTGAVIIVPRARKAQTPKKVSARRKREQAAGFMPELDEATQVLPFTTDITPGFWRSLGRDAAKLLVDAKYPTVGVTANNNARTLALQGPSEDVAAAAQAIEDMWAEAPAAAKEWKKTDPGFLGRSTEPLPRRQQGYHLTEAFYVQFGAWYAQEHDA